VTGFSTRSKRQQRIVAPDARPGAGSLEYLAILAHDQAHPVAGTVLHVTAARGMLVPVEYEPDGYVLLTSWVQADLATASGLNVTE
jgi:hypothetical protein